MKKFTSFFLLFFLLHINFSSAQAVRISTDNAVPDASAILDIYSTSKGILVPRMSTEDRLMINSPAAGLLVYDSTTKSFWFYKGGNWFELVSGKITKLEDLDGDTRVQVEESPDDDHIRFDIAGTERMVLFQNPSNILRLELKDNSGNTYVGENIAGSQTGGFENSALGHSAMASNLSGSVNVAIGHSALFANTSGGFNTAIGYHAMDHNTTGNWNTGMGYYSMNFNTIGQDNVGIGTAALQTNNANNRSTAIGNYAMAFADSRSDGRTTFNTAVGYEALRGSPTSSNNTGQFNTALGYQASKGMTSGNNNVAIGCQSLHSNSTGQNNTTVGFSTMYNNISGSLNTAIGAGALDKSISGNQNTAIGYHASNGTDVGSFNSSFGSESLLYNAGNSRSTAIGCRAMRFADNRFVGRETYNTALGFEALQGSTDPMSNTGRYNSAVGDQALYSNTSGQNNCAFGKNALLSNTTAYNNCGIGINALSSNTIGVLNTAIGSDALYTSSIANGNTAVGNAALLYTTIGGNTAIGSSAGSNSDFDGDCTFLGREADNDFFENAYIESTAVGINSRLTASYQVRIGNSSTSSIGGFEPWTDLSDGRYKKDISSNVPGLEFIIRLHPVTYHLDAHALATRLNEDNTNARDPQQIRVPTLETLAARNQKSEVIRTGFIAQEVLQAAEAIGFDFSGIDKPESEDGIYGLRYSQFVVPLVKAMQEQQELILALQKEVDELKKNY